jgi:rare lipoprotein A
MITNAIILIASWQLASDVGKSGAGHIRYDPTALTCAARQWPIGSKVLVTDTHNGNSVTVTVIDRTRIDHKDRIDLSPAAFTKLNGLALGTCAVKCQPTK